MTSQAAGNALPQRFIDPSDGNFDLSEWLLDHSGFLPVPIIITEPAVGFGGGVALIFFRESLRDAAQEAKESGHVTPPDVFGVGGIATENGTKGGGGGRTVDVPRRPLSLSRRDRPSFTINLDFYGIGGQFPDCRSTKSAIRSRASVRSSRE